MDELLTPFASMVPGYHFIVFLDTIAMGFQKVSGVSREIEMEEYREGGLNTRVHIFPKACVSGRTLHLEKGIYSGVSHPFYIVGEKLKESMTLIVMGGSRLPQKSYIFTGLIVKKWEVGAMDADQNGLLIDRFDISYEDMDVLM